MFDLNRHSRRAHTLQPDGTFVVNLDAAHHSEEAIRAAVSKVMAERMASRVGSVRTATDSD